MAALAYPTSGPQRAAHDAQRWWARLLTRYLRNPASFVTECCYTEDPTNVQDPMHPDGPALTVNPIRLIPPEDFLTQYVVPKYLGPRKVLAIPKARRMIVTWTCCALDLFLAMYTPSAQVYIASKQQADSDKLVQRCLFLYQHLPPQLPKPTPHVHRGQMGDATQIDFLESGSKIVALSETPDDLRQEGATLIHVEEFGFWQWQDSSYTAMLPSTMGGGKVRIVCSARNGTFWERVVYDKTASRTAT